MNSKNTKRALVSSALAVLVCIAMLIGTTFAWFTDTASTSVNKIVSGKLDVLLEYAVSWDADGNPTEWKDAKDQSLEFKKAAAGEAVLWEPGCTYELPELRVSNAGNLALKYKVNITGIKGSAKLNEVIEWTIGDVALGTEQHLAVGGENEFTVKGHMLESAGNDYMNLTIDGIGITVVATQDTVESDSFGKTYDADALKSEYAQKRVGVQTQGDRSLIKRLRKPSEKRYLKSLGVATTEGIGLGLLGIGLPDIPILIGNMIRTCTVSAQSHGLNTDRTDEQVYMLRLIRLAAMPTDERRAANRQLDALGEAIDAGTEAHFDLEEEMRLTSERLSMTLLFSRFVMGLPVVGVAGGLYNPVIVSQLHQLAEVKYEARLLKRVKADLVRQHHNENH